MEPIKSIINPSNSSARQQNSTHDLVDRISDLPDSILGLILSLLPTKNAVATSLLSKRWKFVWMNVHNLDFFHDEDEDEDQVKYKKFIQFVDRILLLQNAGFLNKFHLVCSPRCNSPHASSWISIAITRNVHELYVSAQFDLPINVFSCASLQSLELNGLIKVPATFEVFLPRLENLKLYGLYFQSEEAFEKLISRCPMLNSLYFGDNYRDNVEHFMFIISSTSLRRLEVEILCMDNSFSLKLNVPSLEYLFVTGWIDEIFVQNNLSSLVEACLRVDLIFEESNDWIYEALRSFDCVKALFLSSCVTRELGYFTFSLSTMFTRLVKLETDTYCCNSTCLRDFIENSDNLEVLIVNQCSTDCDIDFCEKWITHVEVPRCLSNSLKKVVVNDYQGCKALRKMVRYILEHGSVLEVMEISCYRFLSDKTQLKLVEKIGKFPIKSAVCEIKLFVWT